MSGAEVNMLKPPMFQTFSGVQSSWNQTHGPSAENITCKKKMIGHQLMPWHVFSREGRTELSIAQHNADAMIQTGSFSFSFNWNRCASCCNCQQPSHLSQKCDSAVNCVIKCTKVHRKAKPVWVNCREREPHDARTADARTADAERCY